MDEIASLSFTTSLRSTFSLVPFVIMSHFSGSPFDVLNRYIALYDDYPDSYFMCSLTLQSSAFVEILKVFDSQLKLFKGRVCMGIEQQCIPDSGSSVTDDDVLSYLLRKACT